MTCIEEERVFELHFSFHVIFYLSPKPNLTISDPCIKTIVEPLIVQHLPFSHNHETYVKQNLYTRFGLSDVDAENATFLLLQYTTSGILKRNTKSYLVDTTDFITNIGGGLGLVLGISIYSVLDYITIKVFDKIILI